MSSTKAESDLIPTSEMKAEFPGTSDQFWSALRHRGGGPVYTKVGRRVFYRRGDIEVWLAANRYVRTDRPVNA